MTRQSSTLPSTAEQAHHALLLLGAPAPARLVVDVHAALFDGDLAMPALTALLRAEQRALGGTGRHALPPVGSGGTELPPAGLGGSEVAPAGLGGSEMAAGSDVAYAICRGLNLDLRPVRGLLALASWPLDRRIVSPAAARADALAMVVRVLEFVAVRPVGVPVLRLIRQLAEQVPGGPEAIDPLDPGALTQAARLALADPALDAAVAREQPARAAAVARAGQLDPAHQLFGVPALPHQREHG
ncbi:MAG: hypothetical protein QOE51_2949 [Actinoplanes sp.]|jgi:hypothetical protein|nr:hypothetical protein [Actinoplanes sp.]